MSPLCPHCGYDLTRDELIHLDGFRIDPRGTVDFNGHPLSLTKAQSIFVASVAKAAPRPIPYAALIERMGIEGRHERNILSSQLCLMRNRLRAYDIALPIVAKPGMGYQWKGA